MIAGWITNGAQIGLTAFFALFVFLLCVLIVMSVFVAITRLIGAVDDD